MSCSDIQHHLHDYMEQALSEAQRHQVEAHVKICPQCRNALSDLKASLALTRDLDELDAPPFLASRIMNQVRSIAEKQSWLNRLILAPVRIPAGVMAAVIVLFASLHIYTIWMLPGKTVPTPLISDNTAIQLPKDIISSDQPNDSGEMPANQVLHDALEQPLPDVQYTLSVEAIDPTATAVLHRLLERGSRILSIASAEGEYRITADINTEDKQGLTLFLKGIDPDVGVMAGMLSPPRAHVSIVLIREPDKP